MVGYVKNFDGLRACSVLAVMLFHTGIPYFKYGWIGVPVFFVLSGFLITNILIASRDSLNYFRVFYARRLLRIFPVYYLTLAAVVLFAFVAGEPLGDWIYFFTYVQNFVLAYNNWSADFPQWFNHTWSLAIEEQFYCFWPVIVKKFSNRTSVAIAFALIITAWISRYVLSEAFVGNSIVWANTLSCLDMLLGGALLSYSVYLVGYRRTFFWAVSALLGFTAIYIFLVTTRVSTAFFSQTVDLTALDGQLFWMLLIPYVCVGMLLLYKNSTRWYEVFFANRVIAYLGKISYGMYLYHFVIFTLLDKYGLAGAGVLTSVIIKFTLTLALAVISWELLEKNFLKLKENFVYKRYENSTVG